MSNFDLKLNELYHEFKQLRKDGCIFQYYEDEIHNGRTVIVNQKELLYFGSCSYMGLETHNAMKDAAIEAIKRYGTQTPNSRAMLSSPLYKELEILLEDMFPGHHVVTQTVTLAHCAALPALIHENDAIILDAYVHNSVRMASQLCKVKGTYVLISKHNDMEHVKYLIYRLKKEGRKNIWYCADGVYSIHGNKCDVAGLRKLLDEEDNFYAYVDDAHGTGWTGKNGSGHVIGGYGLHDKMVVVNSFAKSMATSGGVLIFPEKLMADFISLTGQTMIFSGPIQPSVLGSLIACVKLHLSDEINIYQNELMEKIKFFRKRSTELNLSFVTKDLTPIQLLQIGSIEKAHAVQLKLIDRGFMPTVVSYPAIAKGEDGIRVTITRHLTYEDIEIFLSNIKEIMEEV